MPTADELREQYATAQTQGRGTDMARIKKELVALGAEPAKPRAVQAKAQAAESRASAADADPDARSKAPEGRTSPRGRQSKS